MKKSLKTVLSASMAALCVFGFGMSANAYELNPEVKDVTPALREASTVGVWTAENPAMKNAPNKDAVLVMTFGTTFTDTRAKTIDAVEAAIQKAHPNVPVFEAYTSHIIIDRVKANEGIQKMTPEQLIATIPDYDALVVRSETKVTKEVIAAAKNLKVIGRAGVGVDNIDVEAATQKGIIVLNAPEGNTIAATEHTMAMMLAMARNVPQAYCSMQGGLWERPKFTGVEVRGKTLGILGMGRIGSGVAKRALAMEMNILAYDPFIRADRAEALGVQLAELDEIFAKADFITLHLPLTADTKKLINKAAFAKMKKGVRIINVARGGVIDEADLNEAIEAGIVAGAAIDVFEKEPVDPANPLLKNPKVISTPHLGASTAEAQVGVAVDVAHGVLAEAGRQVALIAGALDPHGSLPVALCGGLAAPLRAYLPEALLQKVVPAQGDSAAGALRLVRQRLDGLPS